MTVNDGAILTVNALGKTQWKPASLTLGSSTGMTLDLNNVTNSGTALAPIAATAVTIHGNTTVNITVGDPNFTVGSSYPLLANAGAVGSYTLGSQPLGWYGTLQVTGGTLVYVTTAEYDFWSDASGNEIWDIGTSTNWVGDAALFNSPQFTYKNGDSVIITDAGTNQNITISGVVTPATIILNNNTNTDVLSQVPAMKSPAARG